MANSTETRTPSSPRSGAEPDRSIRLPGRNRGATITELLEATGWQPHPVRSAIGGTLRKKRGLAVIPEKDDRRGRICRVRNGQTSHIDDPRGPGAGAATTYPPVRRILERGRPS